MKRNHAIRHSEVENSTSDRNRKPIPRAARFLVSILLLVAFLTSMVLLVASVRPFTFTVPTPISAYRQSIHSSYTVGLSANPYFPENIQPSGMIYLREFARSVSVRFNSTFSTQLSGDLPISRRIDAVLKIRDEKNAQVLLLEKTINLLPAQEMTPISIRDNASTTIDVLLLPYQLMAENFLEKAGISGNSELSIRLTSDAIGSRYGETITDHQVASVTIPLLLDQFQITTIDVADDRLMILPVHYLIQPDQVPLFVFPLIGGLFLVLLILFLTLTRTQTVDHFQRDLKRMLRYGRRQLLLISDKAWEPEWCITAADFKSLIRTARKLKHPVFCFVSKQEDQPAAYFYVYYGENNYCYTFKGNQVKAADLDSTEIENPGSIEPFESSAPYFDLFNDTSPIEQEPIPVPLLPETDNSPEL